MYGNTTRASAFKTKTSAKHMPVWAGEADKMGEREAIAVPPHIAVPVEISLLSILCCLIIHPINRPAIRVITT